MVKNLLDGNMDAVAYEDTLREMFGIHAYISFTLDKVSETVLQFYLLLSSFYNFRESCYNVQCALSGPNKLVTTFILGDRQCCSAAPVPGDRRLLCRVLRALPV